ncbi:CHAT domain-containing protein [Spirillospora sp. NPDC127200]
MRDDAFFRLHVRVMRYAEEREPRVILDPAGLAEADELLTQVNPAAQPLHIGDIGALDHGGAELAYLSACDTAVGGAYLPDEAVHTAAAFHHAGYRHVVATLWSLRDRTAAEVADRFYQGLAGEDGPDADRSATALHDAVRELAERHTDDPLRWATFLHIGP